MSILMPQENYSNLLSMNTFQLNARDKEQHSEIEFLYSKFMAMKEIDVELDKDAKLDHHKYSSLKLSKSIVCTNFFESELGRNDLINMLSKM